VNSSPAQKRSIAIIPSPDFADGIPQLYAPLENYVKAVIPLMLEHVWQLKTNNHTSALDELMNCAWIGRLITLDKRVQDKEMQNEIPGWAKIKDRFVKCINNCKAEAELSTMKDACMEPVMPILGQRFQDNYHFPVQVFHCWWYTIHDDNSHLSLHLINAYQPDSPFDQLNHFLLTMLKAVEHAASIYSSLKIVSCGSWLNQLSKFQQLWPESFKQNQKILNETGGFGPGAWGQYMKTNGGFNQAKADILRKTGKHPFALTEGHSPVGEVLTHLKMLLAELKP
jgi:hypothetical protein